MSKFSTSAPSTPRHHADWLSLVEYSGPFVSLPVMLRVFPHGLEPRDPAQAKALRSAYEEWQDNPTAPGKQRSWVLHVLTAVLGYPLDQITEGQTNPAGLESSMPEMGETLRPDFALIGPAGSDTAQLLIVTYPAEQKLDRPVIGKHWKATPATRMMELLHGANVPLGLVTNGEQWMLVYAPRGEITGYASWYGALWLDEPITLRAFHSLLGTYRFFSADIKNTLPALLKESANDQQEVTDQLGYQVREAVEVLVQSFDAIDSESNRILLKGVSPAALYEAALTIMMRLVFLFSAEERGLLHLGKPLYDNNYAVSTLQEQLQEVADRYGEEVLERRTDAWARLLATFRAVHGGIKHQDLLMQAYGGSLFDPDRYPFLEGRAAGSGWRNTSAEPLAVNNRVVLHLLNSLQRLRIKAGAGGVAETRRVSFRALGVEQIGHVYEGLLDHTGVRATETVLGIKGTSSKEAEIPLARLESLLAQGQDKLVDFLKEETGRSVSALRKALNEGNLLDEHKLLVASGHDEALLARIRPFAGLIREDSFERPLFVRDGSVYVTNGTTRRSTGTHYTPPSLTEPIVQYTLEPLVYEGPAEGWSRHQWKLKSPKTILDLRVCDMAMGSGAFLVQTCRYLAMRLTEAWENEEKQHPGQVLITPDGKFSEGAPSERLVPADANERIAIARRVVADRCLYGVDINPMAVEMAKLSLWLITVDANRPFTFLDHAFKCGDSLLGITSLEQLQRFSLRSDVGKLQGFNAVGFSQQIEESKKKREALEEMPSDTPEQIAAKAALYAEAEEAVAKLIAAADLLVAVELKGVNGRAYETEREASADRMMSYSASGLQDLRTYAERSLGGRRCFHWSLAFPEIFFSGGFNAFVGNPPFIGGKKISSVLGDKYERFLKRVTDNSKGAADLSCYFFKRSFALLRPHGNLGLLATNSINEGDSREVGLASLLEHGGEIFHAVNGFRWPGQANVFASQIHFTKGHCQIGRVLNGISVETINSYLQPSSFNLPFKLSSLDIDYTQGPTLNGEGFILNDEQVRAVVEADSANSSVVFPYVNAKIFNSMPTIEPMAWAINFGTRNFDDSFKFILPFQIVTTRVKPARDLLTKQIHEERYWLYWDKREGFFKKTQAKSRLLVCPITTKHLSFRFLPINWVFSHALKLFDIQDYARFGVLQSSLHEAWARQYSSRLKDDLRYSTSDAFDTFAWPLIPGEHLESLSFQYYQCRDSLMSNRSEGLTGIYNRFHSYPDAHDDIGILRKLHVSLDQAVATAYGWQDLELGHDFHETKQGIRYTISEAARREILDRLLALNHQRHAEEEAEKAALPVSASAKRGRKPKETSGQIMMDL